MRKFIIAIAIVSATALTAFSTAASAGPFASAMAHGHAVAGSAAP
jgi:hypothetical protein